MEVAGNPKKYQKKQTPTLEAGMYGFAGGEELITVKGYLYAHGTYQLIVVSRMIPEGRCQVTGFHPVALLYF